MKDIYNRVVKCILEVDKVKGVNFIKGIDINPEFDLTYFDFIEQIELIMECEKEFKVNIISDAINKWKTVQDIVTTIEKLI